MISCIIKVVLKCVCLWWLSKLASKLWQSHKLRRTLHKIPGPPRTSRFQLENISEALDSNGRINVSQSQKWSKRYYPIYKLYNWHAIVITLLKPEDIKLVLSNPKHVEKSRVYELFSNWLGTGLLTSTGEKWRCRRKIITPAFHFKVLKQFVTAFNDGAHRLTQNLHIKSRNGDDNIRIQPWLTQYSLETIAETAMGIKLNTQDESNVIYKRAVQEINQTIIARILKPWLYPNVIYNLTEQSRREHYLVSILHAFTEKAILKRERAHLQHSSEATTFSSTMLDVLLRALRNGRIDHVGIREEVDTFLFEGHDTTSTILGFLLVLIADNAPVQRRLYDEITRVVGANCRPSYDQLMGLHYVESSIKEALRLYPSVPIVSRKLAEGVLTSDGHWLPCGTTVNIDIFNLHRTAALYPDPGRFEPERFMVDAPEALQAWRHHPYAYLPFSAGIRNCIGQKAALLQLKTALVAIITKFELFAVDPQESLVLHSDVVLRPKNELRVGFVPRTGYDQY